MENWEIKLKENYGSATVDKKIALQNEVGDLPRYVAEYLLGFFCQDGVTEESIKEMQDYVLEHRVRGKEKEKYKYDLQMNFRKNLIDKYKVTINLTNKKQSYNTLEIPSLGENNASVLNTILKEHPRLMIDGIWGLAELTYDPEDKHINMTNFRPFQLSNIKIEEFIQGRSFFTTQEWIDALISTIGFNYAAYTNREKMILISRLIPMVEKNVFFMEFGYPGTGKTYAFEQISSYSRVISGSKISAPQLFINLSTKQEGLLSQYDVILFDEIDKVKKGGIDEEVMSKLYQYLASGKFDRGGVEKSSSCSIIMVGNLPKGEFEKESFLNEILNEEMMRDAFLDRLNGIIPGWEIKPIQSREKSLTNNLGFAADYFSEIMNGLRSINFDNVFYSRVKLKDASTRDEDAIRKIFNGFMKLIYPNGIVEEEEMIEILNFAISYRNIVLKQIYNAYKNKKYDRIISYEINNSIQIENGDD